MPTLAERMHFTIAAMRLVAFWKALSTRWSPLLVILIAWALLSLPLVFLRGYNSDEGLAVAIARSAVEQDQWLVPHAFGARMAERPTLLSWIIAAISLPFGAVNQVTVRLPVALFLLGGCGLIYLLLRRVAASIPAALLGVAAFLACPLVLRSYVMATADMPLAVLLFFAFVLWWLGQEAGGHGRGGPSLARWIAIGVVLALAGMLKGPQPIAYFALGVGVYVLWLRAWRQIPGLVLAGIICVLPMAAWYAYTFEPGDEAKWAHFMRVGAGPPLSGPLELVPKFIGETLPATLLAGAFALARPWRSGQPHQPPGFLAALVCYASVASLIMLFWPGGSTPRYYLPALPVLCVFAGLAYDALADKRPQLIAPGLVVVIALIGYGLVYALVAAPLLPQQFRSTKLDAARISELVRAAPAPIYRTDSVGLNELPYVPGRILSIDRKALTRVNGPAWLAITADEAEWLKAQRPAALRVALTFGRHDDWRLVRLRQ